MEKLTKETMSAMTKEELMEAVDSLQLKNESLSKEIQELKHYAEIGKRYEEHLKKEVTKLVKLVEGENSPVLKLVDRADIETLQELEKEYREKAKKAYQPSAVQTEPEKPIDLEKMTYKDLLKLRETFAKEVR